ncbi:YheC/YheD family protein [Ammoniphilus sp. CFH 90114]|uniref:YheC/YheD family endospore coat-associated protein n=1 Tax=Ammoniphilus sp. CFH 90114 TaxID=2493665 RepID=UPI00100EEA7B|nr:YheC/YheD family protein [Ammoniphilus sp. CFH 90114]RXT08165.1 hypothetical protein EIZ39_12250 [Ammoniphilus sp. CFH 90114]
MNQVVKIKSTENAQTTLYAHPKVVATLGLRTKKYRVKFGSQSIEVDVLPSLTLTLNEIEFSQDVIQILRLPLFLEYEIRVNDAKILIGPFIGILVAKSQKSLKAINLNSFSYLYKEIRGMILAFSLQGIDRKSNTIKGLIYNPQKKTWEERRVSYPSSFMKLITISKKWNHYFQTTFPKQFFNSASINKWKMYNLLQSNRELKPHLPLTSYIRTPQDILDFMENNEKAYVKPISGLKGVGIYRVVKENGHYVIQFRNEDKNHKLFFSSVNDLLNYFKKKMKKKKYIIQQALNIEVQDGHVIDFRIALVKDYIGHWRDVGIVGKRSAYRSIVSNRASGGTLKQGDHLLGDAFELSKEKVKILRDKLSQVAITAAREIDKLSLNIGRYGVDIAVDKHQHVWLLEMNHRMPDDYLFYDSGQKDVFYKIRATNMLYAKYLAGFHSLP